MRERMPSSPPVTSMTTVRSYGMPESTGVVLASSVAIETRMNVWRLSLARTKAASASMALASSSGEGFSTQTGAWFDLR